jgi:two-component system, sensor histidine kinase
VTYQPTSIADDLPQLPENQTRGQLNGFGKIVITVSDTGPGLSPEQLLSLFKEGVQFNPNELQAGQGSGLGLWISKEIVALHHGTITARSDGLGTGTTFEVVLPILCLDETYFSARSNRCFFPTPNHRKPHVIDAGFDRYVLVVDDASSNRKLVSRLLKSKGFICHEAENGQECVDKVLAGDHPYEFILLDYEMPVLDGPSAARRLREEKYDLLIIGVTGNVLPEDKAHFIRQGADLVMPKPLDIDELLQNIPKHKVIHCV